VNKNIPVAMAVALAVSVSLNAASLTDVVELKPPTSAASVREFHGHSDPWAVLGARIGDHAVKRLGLEKKMGAFVLVEYDSKLPMTGIADGLQLATGATYGRQSIVLVQSTRLRVRVVSTETKKGLVFRLTESARNKFYQWKSEGYGYEKQASLVVNMTDGDLFMTEDYEDR